MTTASKSRAGLAPWEQVFQTPELALLILEHVEPQFLPMLISVCRAIFYPVAATIWKHTPCVSSLLRLLPCAEIKTIRNYPTYRLNPKIGRNFTFSSPLVDSDFRRFRIYAPFITHLDLYKALDLTVTISGWRRLLDYVDSGHVLLPNLTTLVIKSNDSRCGMLPYPWVAALASRSLTKLYIGWGLRVSPRVGSAILQLLMRLCVRLIALELHIVPYEMEEQEECVLPAPDAGGPDHVAEFYKSAVTLKSLSTTSYVINNYSQHISRLPALRYLEIEAYKSLKEEVPVEYLRDTSFGSLQELRLAGFVSSDVESAWLVSRVTKDITALDVVRTHPAVIVPGDSILDLTFNVSEFLTTCLRECPRLTALRLEFTQSSGIIAKIDEHALQLLSQYPLRELSMEMVWVPSMLDDYVVELVTTLLAHLEVLVWTDLFVPFSELHRFLRMSKLRHLAVRVGSFTLTSADMGAIPWLPRGASGNTELSSFTSTFIFSSDGDWFRFASYISHFWPNIQLSIQKHNLALCVTDYQYSRTQIANKYMRLLRSRGRGGQKDRMRMWVAAGGKSIDSNLYD